MKKKKVEGPRCPKCWCRDLRVVRVLRIADTIRRRRECRHCGHRTWTREHDEGDTP